MENENKVYNIAEAVDGEDFDLAVTCYINPLDPSDGKKTIKYKAIIEEKYESFFAKFFADNGEYLKFMSMKEKRVLSSKYSKTDAQTVCITTVCVDRIKLKEYLQENGILK